MINLYTFLILLLVHGTVLAQTIQHEINNQVWRVQLEAMSENDAEKFMSVMSDDVVQVSYDRGTIRNKADFLKQAQDTYARIKERNLTRSMEFRFLNRHANATMAFEDGFYKYELINKKQEKRVFYGYFQVTLRKEEDIWRVLVDYDAENYNGTPVTGLMFDSAKILSSFDK